MSYQAFYGLTGNPFRKDIPVNELYVSKDFKQFSSRMEYFKRAKGFALAFGRSGMGKTTCIRAYTAKLNPQLFKVVYLPLSIVTVMEFYRSLAIGLGLSPKQKKVDMFHQIQSHIINLHLQKKQTPFIILDEGQFLDSAILNELRMIFNHEMDSKNHAMVLLCAQPSFINKLNLHVHEPLRQRTVVHHQFIGLEPDEVNDFVTKLLENVGLKEPLFSEDAINALAEASSGSPRLICTLAEKSLLIGAQKQLHQLDSEIIQDAYNSTFIYES